MLATIKGKEFALETLAERRERNKGIKRINNSDLPAGAPMYFYCITCGGTSDVLPENYLAPPKKLCNECNALKDLGWLE
ncbi:hypothetical protein LCGC14_1535210 [marine sediment metagenome]|uniref:Uncharacterized protein n=1 Tax=marine sediment metagenome TaxID=412755 RepID=A0A0F9IUR7_9ZZZZ